jgi:hypothetical protein
MKGSRGCGLALLLLKVAGILSPESACLTHGMEGETGLQGTALCSEPRIRNDEQIKKE